MTRLWNLLALLVGVLLGAVAVASLPEVDAAVIDSVEEPGGTIGVLSWCDPGTWVGPIPGPADEARINGPVVVDCDAEVGAVTITEFASLTWVGTSELTVNATAGGDATGRVVVEGRLTMRPTPDDRQTLTFTGIDETAYVGGDEGMGVDPGLYVTGFGVLDVDGPDRTAWTRLTNDTLAGDLLFSVLDSAGWQPGDELVVVPTVPGDSEGYSRTTIVSVDGATITVDPPLQYPHPSVNGHTAEVLNLTRQAVIASSPESGRAHVMIEPSAGVQHLADLALVNLGPQSVQGRYPLHLHRQGDASRGSTFTRLLALESENRAFVAHASHGTTWTDSVAHDVRLTPWWWDRTPAGLPPNQDVNASDDTVWVRAVASDVHPGGRDDPGERFRVAGFALNRGVGNVVTDSVAVGVERNASSSDQSSGFHWPEREAGGGQGVWLFERNVSHNNAGHGTFTWQNTGETHIVSDLIAYGNGRCGINHGAYRNGYLYERVELHANVDCGISLRAVSRDVPQLTFRDVTITGSPVGVSTGHHQQPSLAATVLDGFTFADVLTPFLANPTGNPDLVRVTTWADCPAWGPDALAGSTWELDAQTCTPTG